MTKAMRYKKKSQELFAEGERQEKQYLYMKAATSFQKAASASRKARMTSANDSESYILEGSALRRLAWVEFEQSKKLLHGILRSNDKKARKRFESAIASFSEALHQSPDDPRAHYGKAAALKNYGDLQLNALEYDAAMKSYSESVFECDETLKRAPDSFFAYLCKGLALTKIGTVQESKPKDESKKTDDSTILNSYSQAMQNFEKAIKLAPDSVLTYKSEAATLEQINIYQQVGYTPTDEILALRKAVYACAKGLDQAPNDIEALQAKGSLLEFAGMTYEGQATTIKESIIMRQLAADAYSAAIKIDPDDDYSYYCKGECLREIAELQNKLANYHEAMKLLEDSLQCLSQSLKIDPSDAFALLERGRVYRNRAKLEARNSQLEKALCSLKKSVADYQSARRFMPIHPLLYMGTGLTLDRQAELEAKMSLYKDAQVTFGKAALAYKKNIRSRAGFDPWDYSAMGESFRQRAILLAKISNNKAARKCFQESIVAFETSSKLMPKGFSSLKGKAEALKGLADLQIKMSLKAAAQVSLEKTIDACDQTLKYYPSRSDIIRIRDSAQTAIRNIAAPVQ